MPTLNKKQQETVKRLYKEKEYSARQIAEYLGVRIDAVYYIMRKNNIERRTAQENSAITFKNKPLSFKLKQNLTQEDKYLRLAAVMLYWAEGYKTEKSAGLDFANSDTESVLIFLKFLRKICRVDESRLKVLLYCYSNQNPQNLVSYWSELLDIPDSQFTKPYVRRDFRVEKSHKMPYGLVHVRYMDKKLLWQVLDWIEEYKKIFASVPKRSTGAVCKTAG